MRELNTPYANYKIIDGILHFTYMPGIRVTKEIAQKIVEDRVKFIEGQVYPSLGKDDGIKGADKDARDYLSTQEAIQGVSAAAFLAKSEFFKFLVNFFIKVNVISQKIPVKVFTDESDALKWLEQFKQK